jgi:hypothetical protein
MLVEIYDGKFGSKSVFLISITGSEVQPSGLTLRYFNWVSRQDRFRAMASHAAQATKAQGKASKLCRRLTINLAAMVSDLNL